MSYILSALKKAESERREQAEDVGVSPMVEPRFAEKSAAGPALVFLGAVIALVVLVIWLWLAASTAPAVLVVSEPLGDVVKMPTVSPARSSDFADSVEFGSIKPVMAPGQKAVSTQKSVFDNIDIKGHLYVATRPSLRKVVINDSTLREGEKINGIVVEEITETGVILSFEGVEKTISAY